MVQTVLPAVEEKPVLECGPNGWYYFRYRGVTIAIGPCAQDEYRQMITIGLMPRTAQEPRPKVSNFAYTGGSINIDYFLEKDS